MKLTRLTRQYSNTMTLGLTQIHIRVTREITFPILRYKAYTLICVLIQESFFSRYTPIRLRIKSDRTVVTTFSKKTKIFKGIL